MSLAWSAYVIETWVRIASLDPVIREASGAQFVRNMLSGYSIPHLLAMLAIITVPSVVLGLAMLGIVYGFSKWRRRNRSRQST
jgi:hypothetical protein